jgi:hypothetical protein
MAREAGAALAFRRRGEYPRIPEAQGAGPREGRRLAFPEDGWLQEIGPGEPQRAQRLGDPLRHAGRRGIQRGAPQEEPRRLRAVADPTPGEGEAHRLERQGLEEPGRRGPGAEAPCRERGQGHGERGAGHDEARSLDGACRGEPPASGIAPPRWGEDPVGEAEPHVLGGEDPQRLIEGDRPGAPAVPPEGRVQGGRDGARALVADLGPHRQGGREGQGRRDRQGRGQGLEFGRGCRHGLSGSAPPAAPRGAERACGIRGGVAGGQRGALGRGSRGFPEDVRGGAGGRRGPRRVRAARRETSIGPALGQCKASGRGAPP